MTGVTSTPPIGATNVLVNARKGSVGHDIKGHKPWFKLTLGYQVRMILIKNAILKADKLKPSKK
tara:strand:+ start:232 stop:423 length:192 start_codon:yes stop_codon:yes gene_type:complete